MDLKRKRAKKGEVDGVKKAVYAMMEVFPRAQVQIVVKHNFAFVYLPHISSVFWSPYTTDHV